MGNSIGEIFRVTTFGESHGPGIGAVIDGCPAGLEISVEEIQKDLDRRRPGQSHITTQRKESDTVEILSGVFENKSQGTPIALFIPNEDAKSKDYDHLKETFRPSHADFTYYAKYGMRDHRGGGRSSARATAAVVAAGAIAKKVIRHSRNDRDRSSVVIGAFVTQVGSIQVAVGPAIQREQLAKGIEELVAVAESNIVRCPDEAKANEMISLIEQVRKDGDTIGGVITCMIQNCPTGLGEPLFGKLQADLAKAMFSINAVHGFEYGSGFDGATKRGSENNDAFYEEDGKIKTRTNFSGGIQGGISNGMEIYFRVAFKPVATIVASQESVNTEGGAVEVKGKGRHDPCVVPRAVPIVEAMTAIVLADHLLRNRSSRI
ncbi:MAG TPA: chorismate synthase [Chitinophagales bacterium]|nr:chorismate synthase [Chitinophagales bacterium]